MTTFASVWNTRFMPVEHVPTQLAELRAAWSIVGWSIARRTRSGTLVGPGICRKWRPDGAGGGGDMAAIRGAGREATG